MAKFLWRAAVSGVTQPIYLVSQNAPSAAAQATAHPQVEPDDLMHLQRLAEWDDSQNMTVVFWPQPPPPPPPDEDPPG